MQAPEPRPKSAIHSLASAPLAWPSRARTEGYASNSQSSPLSSITSMLRTARRAASLTGVNASSRNCGGGSIRSRPRYIVDIRAPLDFSTSIGRGVFRLGLAP